MINVHYFEEVTSTNDVVRDFPEWTLVMAGVQTKGRGQRGSSWEGEKGRNLTFSLLVEPGYLPVEKQFYISKVTALAVAEALGKSGVEAAVKWPNDIYAGDKKICGILIENDLMGNRMGKCVIGIGINVNQQVFLSDAPNPTSVWLETGVETDRMELLKAFCDSFINYYNVLSAGNYDRIDRDYWTRLYRKGRWFEYEDGKGRFTGKITGVFPSGELVILHEDGTEKKYLFKEVSYCI